MEIMVTFPMEYVKTQVSEHKGEYFRKDAGHSSHWCYHAKLPALFALFDHSYNCSKKRLPFLPVLNGTSQLGIVRQTLCVKMASLDCIGGASWILFAAPRSAVPLVHSRRFREHRGARLPDRFGQPAGHGERNAGWRAREALPDAQPGHRNQNDPTPHRAGQRYKGLIHAVATMWRESGFLGFYQGVVPAVVKGAATK